MHDPPPRARRESPATYRRRRLVVGAGAVAVVALPLLLGARLAGDPGIGADTDADQVVFADAAATSTTTSPPEGEHPPVTAGATTTGAPTTVASGPAATGPATTVATSTAPLVAGFATPHEFLACVRARESRGDYTAVSAGGGFFGAYQIDQVTWDSTAAHAGLSHLTGIQPNLAAPASQDTIAMALLQWQGAGPRAGGCIHPAPGT